jgi:hypothetical protein
MFIHGSPISADFPQDLGLKDRFWYWHGASGKKYIHSIYPANCCPPLPGAIYVAVNRVGALRTAIAVGRVPSFQACAIGARSLQQDDGVTEIHVHLLATDSSVADDILRDLQEAFDAELGDTLTVPGFHETTPERTMATYLS